MKFNTKQTTTNLAGGSAYKMLPWERVMTFAFSNFIEDKYYESANSGLERFVEDYAELCKQDTDLAINICLFTRNEMLMRSTSYVMAAELARNVKGDPRIKDVIKSICWTPRDMKEILAYHLNTYGKPIPNSMKKGLAAALSKFDEYSLAKYNNKDGAVSLKDIINLTHPTPKSPEQGALWKRVLEDKLTTPITWETELSANGNTEEAWAKVIESGNLGYMAALRNLRNIAQNASSYLAEVLEQLTDRKNIKKSNQLGFRYVSAIEAITDADLDYSTKQTIINNLKTAYNRNIENLPRLEGRTCVLIDASGSMNCLISSNSTTSIYDIACLLGGTVGKMSDDVAFYAFGTDFRSLVVDPNNFNPFSLSAHIGAIRRDISSATYLYKPLEHILNRREKYDRIIIISDMQAYTDDYCDCGNLAQSAINKYRQSVNPNVWIHSLDLAGYGTSAVDLNSKTALLSGWNERILKLLPLLETDKNSLLNTLRNYSSQF